MTSNHPLWEGYGYFLESCMILMSYRAGESLISTSAVKRSWVLPLLKGTGGGAVTFAAGDGTP